MLQRGLDHPGTAKTATSGRTRFTNLPAGAYIALLIKNDTIVARLPLVLPAATATEIAADEGLKQIRQVADTYGRD